MSLTKNWRIEQGHSQIQFKVKHLAITYVNGIFKTFEGTITNPEQDFDNAVIKVSIAANSIDTQLSERDKHLKSAYLFDTENYPLITFEGVFKKINENYVVDGNLTLRNVTKPVSLNAKITGAAKGFAGDDRAGFEIDGRINRNDFDLTWNIAANSGGLVIGDEIKLHFDIQLVEDTNIINYKSNN
jgi:polyisoprenoid-binding protein YceI